MIPHLIIVPTGSEVVGMEAEVTQEVPEVMCEAAGEDAAETEQASLTDGESTSAQPAAVSNGEESDEGKEMVEVKIIWNKNKYDLKMPLDGTGAKLKEKIHTLTGNHRVMSFKPVRLCVSLRSVKERPWRMSHPVCPHLRIISNCFTNYETNSVLAVKQVNSRQ